MTNECNRLDDQAEKCEADIVIDQPVRKRSSWLRRHTVDDLEWNLIKGIAQNLWPMFAQTLCQALLATICMIFCGHLSTTELTGVALALTVLSISGFSFAEGLTSASQTHFSQTFGSGQTSRMDMYLVKSLLILPFFLLPCIAIHVNIEYILAVAGQRPEVARIASRFLLICIPALLLCQFHYIFMDYMTCQNIRFMATMASFSGFLTVMILNYVLVYVLGLRTHGSAIALAMATCVMVTVDVIYVFIVKHKHWAGFSTEVFMDWLHMIGIALAGVMMMCLEWWGLEIAIVITSFVGEVELSALSVVLNLHLITTILPISFSMGTSIIVGQHLGAGEVDKMKKMMKLAYLLITVVQLVFAVIMFFARFHLPWIFTSDVCVINNVADILSIHVISIFFNGLLNVSIGVMRGSGRQFVASVVIFIGLYVIGLPLGAILMFLTDMKVKGIVTGIAVGTAFNVLLILTVIIKTDWERQSRIARKRVKAEVEIMEKRGALKNGIIGENDMEAIALQAPLATPEMSVVSLKERLTACLLLKRVVLLGSLAAILLVGVLIRLYVLIPEKELCSGDQIFNGTSLPYGVRFCPEMANASLTLDTDHQIVNMAQKCIK